LECQWHWSAIKRNYHQVAGATLIAAPSDMVAANICDYGIGNQANMPRPMFSGRQLDDATLHSRNVKLWIATKKLPARAAAIAVAGAVGAAGYVAAVPADAKKTMAEISYFSSMFKDAATLWFNGLTIDVVPAVGVISSLNLLVAALETQFANPEMEVLVRVFQNKTRDGREIKKLHTSSTESRSESTCE